MSVSYTHLDVYKRQTYVCVCVCVRERERYVSPVFELNILWLVFGYTYICFQ